MALPTELDFLRNPEATPGRMNAAMEYLIARLRALEALTPEFESSINLLRQVGLDRLAEVLVPIFNDANATAAMIDALRAEYETDTFKGALSAEIEEAVIEEFADYRHRYLGAKDADPTVRDDETAVEIGDMYFNTVTDLMMVLGGSGWKNAGSVVSGIMDTFALTATDGQTTFTIPLGYEPGNLIVFVNGTALETGDYTATNGATVVMPSGLSAGDSVSGVKFGSITLSNVYNKTAADALFRTIADSYTKAQVDGAVGAKANTADVYSKSTADARYFKVASNLSESSDAAALRTALGLGALAVLATVSDASFSGQLSVAKGGTGVSSLASLLAALSAMAGAGSSTAGSKGLVPAPAAGDQNKALYGDGTWRRTVQSGSISTLASTTVTGDGWSASWNSITAILTVTLDAPAASVTAWGTTVQARPAVSTSLAISTMRSKTDQVATYDIRNGSGTLLTGSSVTMIDIFVSL